MTRRFRIDLRFALAGLLAIIAAVVVMVLTRPVERVSVLVAAAPLPPGVPLADLQLADVLVEPIDGLIRSSEREITEQRMLAVAIEVGSPLLWSALAPDNLPTGDVLALTLEPGNAVQGDLRAGDIVDIYVSDDEGTRRVAESISVVDAALGNGGLGGDDVAILLAVDQLVAETVIASQHAGVIDLVRRGR